MVFYTRAHDVVAEDGWDGAVPASRSNFVVLMLGYCDMVDEIEMRVLESLAYSLHNSIAVSDSFQKQVNLSAWLSEEQCQPFSPETVGKVSTRYFSPR